MDFIVVLNLLFFLFFVVGVDRTLAQTNDFQCFITGECQNDQHLDIKYSHDEYDCLEICKNNPLCTWFTFYPASETCHLSVGCGSVDATQCPLCVSGQTECSPPEPDCQMVGQCLGNVIHIEENVR